MQLQVFVARGCAACRRARALARRLANQFPQVHVEVVELDGQRLVPDQVVATPTYLLDGRRLWLGNPTPEAAQRELSHRLATRCGERPEVAG